MSGDGTLRAVDLRAVDLRAVDLRAVDLRAVEPSTTPSLPEEVRPRAGRFPEQGDNFPASFWRTLWSMCGQP
ncbi:MAG: hypothetical protein DSY81_05395 [Bacillota bacterium]|nr:MAG: hypothetical protein DSY92_06945 [Planctomycetota bacterium]RUA09786.1 MAG: hypothetical protein DSY81_05395 [Bacillota bacterium]